MRDDYRKRFYIAVAAPDYFIPITSVVEETCETSENQSDIYANFRSIKDFSFTIEAKTNKGVMDLLLGKDTPAARRCIRHGKRMKEKRRRNRLKYGKREA